MSRLTRIRTKNLTAREKGRAVLEALKEAWISKTSGGTTGARKANLDELDSRGPGGTPKARTRRAGVRP